VIHLVAEKIPVRCLAGYPSRWENFLQGDVMKRATQTTIIKLAEKKVAA